MTQDNYGIEKLKEKGLNIPKHNQRIKVKEINSKGEIEEFICRFDKVEGEFHILSRNDWLNGKYCIIGDHTLSWERYDESRDIVAKIAVHQKNIDKLLLKLEKVKKANERYTK